MPDDRRRGERASALVLMPAAVLVLVVLAAIVVDFAVAMLGEREAADAAHAAANDAAAVIDEARFRATGEVVVDCGRAARVVDASFAARSTDWFVPGTPSVRVTACTDDRVDVAVRADVAYVFAPALPGAPDRVTVEAFAAGSAVRLP